MVSRIRRKVLRKGLFFFILFCVPLWLTAANHLKKMEIGADRLLLQFDHPIERKNIRSFVLKGSKGFRYVFDIKNCRLGTKNPTKTLRYNPPLRSIRAGQYRSNVVRVVIESSIPYAMAHYPLKSDSYLIALPKGSSKRTGSVRGLFAEIGQSKKAHASPSKNRVKRADTKLPRAKKHKRAGRKAAAKSRLMKDAPPRPHRRYTVIVDPGHGGHDSGAQDPTHRYWEKRAVLAIALKLRKHLRKMGFRVVMTRSNDRFIKLHRRTRYANIKHGDIFVSVHANAVGNLRRAAQVHGIETYFLSPARSARARRVAAKENSIAFKKYYQSSMNTFLKTLTRSKIVLSNKLALDVQSGMLRRLRERYRGVVDGGVRPAPFWVLVGAEMPAVLVETGYITHPWEKKRLYDPAYQDRLAQGIAEGIARYLINRERELE